MWRLLVVSTFLLLIFGVLFLTVSVSTCNPQTPLDQVPFKALFSLMVGGVMFLSSLVGLLLMSREADR